MGSVSVPQQNGRVLTSWKDIARYMGKGVRTVQRWEMDFGLPVRRPQGSNKKAVLARPADLDAWVALRCSSRADQPNPVGSEGKRRIGLIELHAQLETSRLLCESNKELTAQVKQQLSELRRRLTEMKQR